MESKLQTQRRTTLGVALSLVGGILILVQGLLIFLYGAAVTFLGFENEVRNTVLSGLALGLVGFLGAAMGLAVVVGAYLMYIRGAELVGGTIVILGSVLSILIGGGWLFGLGLGIIGGILGVLRK
jgi:hypothetical protein